MTARVWVAGGRGMLGQAVGRMLEALGHAVLCTGREVDIAVSADVQAYARAHKPTHIINCAAYTKVDACETETALARRANAIGPSHIAAVAAALGAPVAHVSTDYVFDGTATTPYEETALCAPLGVYGQTKYDGECAFWAALEAGKAKHLGYVVRTSWLFGHGGPNFVTTMLRLMAQRETLGVVADQVGRPTFCDDLATALLALLGLGAQTPLAQAPGVYHFANAGVVSWHGFATAILAEAKARSIPLTCASIRAIGTADYPTPAQRPAYSVFCTDKVAHALGGPPRHWQEALDAFMAQHWASDPATPRMQTQATRLPRPAPGTP